MESIIQLDNVSKWYGEVIGLNKVTSEIAPGITGLLGPNGAGKTTMIGLVTGQLRASQGSVRVLGAAPWNNPAVLSQIGYCPEGDVFWNRLTGRQFVTFLARLSGLDRREGRRAALEAIDLVQMTPFMDRAIRTYSKGMRQRIKIAQALAHRPKMLVLDEPFTGADPVARHQLMALFRRLAEGGVHVLVSSHVLHEIEALTRQMLMLDRGRIVAQGSLADIRRRLHDQPHAIRVRLDDPRRLAGRLAGLPALTGIRFMDPDTLILHTTHPEEIYDRLPALILECGLAPREIVAEDESLEAVFGYLTHRRG